MNIKIIGSNCSNGIKLKKQVNKAIENIEDEVIVELLDDSKKQKYSVKNIPGLVINDALVSEGKVLSDREILRFLKSAV